MKVSVLPGDDSGCGRYRLIMPADAVREIRPDWQITTHAPRGEVQLGSDRRGNVVEVIGIDTDTDVLVMQRSGTALLAGLQDWAHSHGIATAIDFDDAMWTIHPENAAHAAWNRPRDPRGQHWRWCDYTAERADVVTVTTDGLAHRYGSHGRVEVIGNYAPSWALDAPSWRERYDDDMTFGWVGYTSTHPYDLNVSAPAAQLAPRRRVVADAKGAAKVWGSDVDAVPAQPFNLDYFSAISTMDIMLVGLRSHAFNRCKSWLKVIEAGAAGVPAIASATQPHRQLARRGYPVDLAESPAEWVAVARRYLDDPGYLRARRRALLSVRRHYTIEAHAERWAAAWQRARARRDRMDAGAA